MKCYKVKVYIDDGMERGTVTVWTYADSKTAASLRIEKFYNDQYDTFVKIEKVEEEQNDLIFTRIAKNNTTYYN